VRILALDTATENCSAALLVNGALLEREELLGRGHAERILPMLSELLAEAGVTLGALDALAFGRGPGAFTGVRLAASVAQGLAFGAALRVVPVSDLRALAQRVLQEEPAVQHVLVCTDARMREVYCGAFERAPDGSAAAIDEERVVAPQAVRLPEAWHAADRAGLRGAGGGFAAYPQLKQALAEQLGGVREQLWPRAAEIARLAVAEVSASRTLAPEEALPVYLRNDVARPPPQTRSSH
jgi:tRNA threonylcarbamoyladenosine biosynthesis protein TsaB